MPQKNEATPINNGKIQNFSCFHQNFWVRKVACAWQA